jgi:hypothetical protein
MLSTSDETFLVIFSGPYIDHSETKMNVELSTVRTSMLSERLRVFENRELRRI